VPPFVTSLGPGDSVPGSLEDENVLDPGAVLNGGINNSLGGDGLSTSSALIGGDQNAGLAVVDAVPKRLGGETGENDRVDGTDTSAGEESGNGVPGHWHVDGDGVALFDSHILEDICYAANFTEKLGIGDFAAFIRLIGLVYDCSLFERRSG